METLTNVQLNLMRTHSCKTWAEYEAHHAARERDRKAALAEGRHKRAERARKGE